jgi:hypothetical protein
MHGSQRKEAEATKEGNLRTNGQSYYLLHLRQMANFYPAALATSVILPFLAICLSGCDHSGLWVHIGPACVMPDGLG